MATEFICTCNKTGEDYGTIAAWEAAVQADLTAAATKVFSHGGITGTVGDGATVTGQTSGATGTVAHCTSTQIMLTGITGTFQSGEEFRVSVGNSVTSSDAGDSVIAVLALYDDDGAYTGSATTIDGWTVSTTNNVEVRCTGSDYHGGNRTDGSAGNGFLWNYGGGVNSALTINEQYTVIDGLQFTMSSAGRTLLAPNVDGTIIVKNCIARDCDTDRGIFRTWQVNSTWVNCLAYNIGGTDGDAWHADGGSGVMTCLQCNAYNCSDGSNARGFNTAVCKNCASFNCDDDYGGCTLTTCASSDTSGSSGLQSLTATDEFTSLTGGAEDFHLKATSNLISAGTDLSAEIDDVDTDVDGDTRSNWDIGFDEYVSAGTTVTPGSQSMTLTLNAPTVSIVQSVTVTPSTQGMEITLNAPTVSITGDVTVTPGSQSLALTLNAPTVVATQNPTVTPATQTLTLTQNAPTIDTSGNVTVAPATQTMTLTLNAPSVAIQQDVTVSPSTQTLTLTQNAPSVSTDANVTVSPSTQSMALTLNAPTISISGATTVNPATQTMTLTLNAPSVTATQNPTITPSVFTLTLTQNAPSVDVGLMIYLARLEHKDYTKHKMIIK